MNQIILAQLEFKHLIYLFFFVLWILGQVSESKKKKRLAAERAAAAHRGGGSQERPQPAPAAASSGDEDLQRLLAQLTGQPPPPQRTAPARSTPAPPPIPLRATQQQHVTLQSQRSTFQRSNRPQQRAAPVAARNVPRTRRETYELQRAEPSAAPRQVAAASVSVAYKDLNVRDRHMHTPPLQTAPASLMRATADAQRLAWIKSPKTLRQLMTARFVLDPPKALSGFDHA